MIKSLLCLTAIFAQADATETADTLENNMARAIELLREDPWAFAGQYLSGFALNLIAALAIYIIGRWAVRVVCGLVRRIIARAQIDETLGKFLANILNILLTLGVIIAALGKLGVPTTSFAAILAAAGFAVGFALKDSLGNFAAGVMLIMFKPFEVDDYVEAGGSAGTVEEVRIFSTQMRTGDNRQILVPNSAIVGSTITNYSAKETRRIDLVIGCGYEDDLRAVKEFLESLLAEDERVLEDPAPLVGIDELGDSSINFVVRPWVKAGDYGTVRRELLEAIKFGFDERGFNIPFPTQHVHIVSDAA